MHVLKTNLQIKTEHTEQMSMENTNILEYISKRHCNGIMGVPITFTDKANPQQFKILGILQSSTDEQAGIPNLRFYNNFKEMRQDMTFTGSTGGKANGNPVIQGKSIKGNFLYCEGTDEYVHSVYARIVIQKVL